MTPRWACLLAALGVAVGKPQSNYNLQDLNIEFEEGAGLPEFGTLDGTVTELGEFQKYIVDCSVVIIECWSHHNMDVVTFNLQ